MLSVAKTAKIEKGSAQQVEQSDQDAQGLVS